MGQIRVGSPRHTGNLHFTRQSSNIEENPKEKAFIKRICREEYLPVSFFENHRTHYQRVGVMMLKQTAQGFRENTN